MDPDGEGLQRGRGTEPGLDADAVDRLVDEVLARPCDGGAGEDDGGLTAALQRVRELGDEPLPPASRTRHLTRIHKAEAAPSSSTSMRRPRGRVVRRRLTPVAAAAAALVLLAGGGTVAIAQDADPDHALYPVKRSTERAWLALPHGSERAAAVHLALAERRVARGPAQS